MKEKLLNFLKFIRVVDVNDGLLSITNVAMIIVLYKLIAAPVTSITDVGSLIIAMSSYSFKKYINKNSTVGAIVAKLNPDAVGKDEKNDQ